MILPRIKKCLFLLLLAFMLPTGTVYGEIESTDILSGYDFYTVWKKNYTSEDLAVWGTANRHKLKWILQSARMDPLTAGGALLEESDYADSFVRELFCAYETFYETEDPETFLTALTDYAGTEALQNALEDFLSSDSENLVQGYEDYTGLDSLCGLLSLEAAVDSSSSADFSLRLSLKRIEYEMYLTLCSSSQTRCDFLTEELKKLSGGTEEDLEPAGTYTPPPSSGFSLQITELH